MFSWSLRYLLKSRTLSRWFLSLPSSASLITLWFIVSSLRCSVFVCNGAEDDEAFDVDVGIDDDTAATAVADAATDDSLTARAVSVARAFRFFLMEPPFSFSPPPTTLSYASDILPPVDPALVSGCPLSAALPPPPFA
eukprot:CAMPEP_0183350258 /NCGR_PEP_ID=MMETSP0164_2-20130417/18393_1 /TAXON_ID=221442 /ORGANISM="Coccolithus pelagicus ssp braarudi, Strain PLY182g" /LENGTH=137 /DNA_ID=CAMNT_0025522149 /DNA_START=431 /DNA_END=842 /DNA_ORIENTATION=-